MFSQTVYEVLIVAAVILQLIQIVVACQLKAYMMLLVLIPAICIVMCGLYNLLGTT